MTLDVRRLDILRAVADAGSLSAAADALSYTPSAVSQQIAALEREVGMPVVVRLPRGVRLTQAGERLCHHAEAIGARLRAAEADVRALRDLRAGRVRVAVFHSAAVTLLPPAAAAFRAAHPDVTLELAERDPATALTALDDGALDVALAFSYDGPVAAPGGVTLEPLAEEPILVALPEGHREARRRRVALGRLAGEPWVQCSSPTCAAVLPHAGRRHGFTPDVVFASADYAPLLGMVAAGLAVALVPRLAVASVPPGVVIRPCAPPAPTRHIAIALAREGERAPAATAFAAALRDAAGAALSGLPSRDRRA